MNILLLGSGGREHAFAWKLKQSPIVKELFIAPGNAGTASLGKNLSIKLTDFEALKQECLSRSIDMLVVGPEEPLVKGVYDFFRNDPALRHIPVIGPSAAGARLEGSKDFAKAFMFRHGIPTAPYQTFTSKTIEEAFAFLETLSPPYVLKADGLAAGKGVLIIDDLEEAQQELRGMLGGRFGEAGHKVVIEQFLKGIECSVFILTDGKHYHILPVAKDYKRMGEGDTGPNTGGMGAVSPVPFAGKEFMEKVERRIVRPTIDGLQAEGIPYKGFIFLGLINVEGEPFVIEYNCRMGDPETQAVLPRICNDLAVLFEAVATGTLQTHSVVEDPRTVATVVLTSGGYPAEYEKGYPIERLDAPVPAHTVVFHAATKKDGEETVTDGGRVLAVSAYGGNLSEAVQHAYETVRKIHFPAIYYRRDIGSDL
ncbi:phosphoribosylamine--glycine ligase [Bacteroidia bacterium]|nr:phosphoribosylamine--glycine ligase [Bacteroidia bacterium]